MKNRLIELETKISYQDHIIGELNDVVTHQQEKIDRLEKGLEQLRQHLKQNNSTELARPDEEVPPPHY
ncbi:MAG: SlyX family protein [Mariprofundus sp.]